MPESPAERAAEEAAARGELTQGQKDDQLLDETEAQAEDAEAAAQRPS